MSIIPTTLSRYSPTWTSEGYFTSADVRSWQTETVWWSLLPTFILTCVMTVGYLLELCARKLSLNRPGVRVKTLSRSYKRRTKSSRKRTFRNGPEYRYERNDHVVYTYDQNDEYYPYNRIYLYMTFHAVALGICIHFDHGEHMLWLTWTHFFFFLVYIWFEVTSIFFISFITIFHLLNPFLKEHF